MRSSISLRAVLVFSLAVAMATMFVFPAGTARAASVTWDIVPGTVGAGNGSITGGTGTWNTTNGNWTTDGGANNVAWSNANNDTAVFGGTAGTVTLGEGITVGGLTFNTTNYVVQGVDANTLTFGAASNSIVFNNIAAATITGAVGGSGNVALTAMNPVTAGTLTLNGTSAGGWSGTTTLNNGMTLALAAGNQALFNTSGITLNGGGITLTNTSTAEAALDRVANGAAVTSNGGTITWTNTSGADIYAETIGSVALTSGQLNIVEATNQTGAGSQTLTLSGLAQSGSAAVTFSAASTAPQASGNKNMILVSGASATPAGQIIGPWATTGTAANSQNDYAVYDASGYIVPANIAASTQDTWANATDAYTLSIPAKTATALTATRNIAALKASSTATVTSATTSGSPTFTIAAGHSLNVGDPVALSSFSGDLNNFNVGRVYYVAGVTGTTFTLAATPGGTAINAGAARTVQFTGGLKLDSGINLGTTGILNSGNAPLAIGRTAAGGNVTLPTAGAGNLYITTGLTPVTSANSGLNGRISIEAPIVDNGGALTLVKNGAGVLRLQGTNTYTGGTVINAGTVILTADNNFGDAGKSITFNGSGALSFGPNSSWAFASGGTIDLGSHPITVNNGAVAGLYFNSPNMTMNVPGAITGSGGIIYGRDPVVTYNGGSGGENISLSSTGNNFTGPLTLGVNASENIGTGGDITFNSLADSTSPITFNLGGGGWTVSYGTGATAPLSVPNRPIDLRNSNATIRNQNGTFTMTLGAVSTSTSGAKTLNLGNGGAGGFVAGAITDGLGSISVAKSGTGTWVLSGANTYTGGTTVSAGTLSANAASALGAGSVTVTAGTLQIDAANAMADTAALRLPSAAAKNITMNADDTVGSLFLAGLQQPTGAYTSTGLGSAWMNAGAGILTVGSAATLPLYWDLNGTAAGAVNPPDVDTATGTSDGANMY